MKKKFLMFALLGAFATATLAGCGDDKDSHNFANEQEEDDDDKDDDDNDRNRSSRDDEDDEIVYEIDEEEYLDAILGYWVEDIEDDPLLINIYSQSGLYCFDLETIDGDPLDHGIVELTYEDHPDDSVSLWYTLTTADGYEFTSFAVDVDDLYPSDLYTGQDGADRFIRLDDSFIYEDEGQGQMGDVEAEDFIGVFQAQDGDITMEVIDNEDGTYFVDIIYLLPEEEVYEWNYFCNYDDDNEMLWCDDGGELWDLFYEDGELVTKSCQYANGSAIFYFFDGNLVWQDDIDNSEVTFDTMVY